MQVLLGRSDVSGWGAFLKVLHNKDHVLRFCLLLASNNFFTYRIVSANMNTLVNTLGS